MERFVLNTVAEVALSVEESEIPVDFSRFKKINSKDEPQFKKLFGEEIIIAHMWINHISLTPVGQF